MSDKQLYARAAAMARKVPEASKVIRALLSECNRKDRELSEWRSGRMAQALDRENESLRVANRYLSDMLREQKRRAS